MTKIVSTRLNEEEVKILNKIAKLENVDRSGLIRKFLLQQIKEYNIRKMAEFCRKGVISLQEAATAATVSLYEMMDYVQKEKIYFPSQSEDEILNEIKESEEI